MGRARFAWRERHSRRLILGPRRPAGPASSSFGFAARLARAAACLLALALVFVGSAAEAQTSNVLVSNIGQHISGSEAFSNYDFAQGFTTGSNAHGYRLTSIEVKFHTASDSNLVVKVRRGSPSGTEVATLTNPATLGTGNQTFTAPANTTLAANTTYYVVLTTTTAGGLQRTSSDSEDSGGASGWSIANNSKQGAASWNDSTLSLLIRVNGVALGTLPPTVASAAVNGDRLTVTFGENLDTGSAPSGFAFSVTARRPGGTAVRTLRGGLEQATISGATATVSLFPAAAYGETLTVSYVKPAVNPLQGAGGVDVAAFAGQTAANNTPYKAPPTGGDGVALVDLQDACTDTTCPHAPTGHAEPGPGHGEITVSWTPAATGVAVARWQFKVTPDGGTTSTINSASVSERTRTFTGLGPAKTHNIVVQGIGAGDVFGNAAVARNVRPRNTAPTMSGASTSATQLVMTFN